YMAVLHALRTAADHRATEAHLRSDSRCVIGQLAGGWKVNYEHLRLLHAAVQEQVDRFPEGVTFERIPRTENQEADKLAKAGRDASESAKRFVWEMGDLQILRPGMR
ncbi:MAG: reverse transcriptase-like protein, partial [Actinobacteria bacterium]|nr:reverse transcriptase-like protein [Actinomycetota bacterium]